MNHTCTFAIRLWFPLLLSTLMLWGCAQDAVEVRQVRKPLAPVDPVTISAVNFANKDGVLQVAITGSKPFSYSINNHDTPPSITVDIQQAQFAGLPAQLTVGQGGVKTIQLSKVGGQEGAARLEIQLEEQAAYSVAKEQERLLVRIQPPARMPSPPASPVQPVQQEALPRSEGVPSPAVSALLQQTAPPTLSPSSQDYSVGPRDVLAITVYDEPDLSKKLRVSESGAVSFPLIGQVQVQGLTPTQIEEKLASLLSKGYLLNPQVFVEVAEFESQKVFILGAIEKPINFTLRGHTTLLELLSQTGKLGRGERGGQSSSLVVFRQVVTKDAQEKPVDKEVKTIRIDLERLLRQGDLSLNLVLQAHDVIYVPEPDSVFVFGQVGKPGPLPLPEGSMTLVEAVSKAGGFTNVAAPSRTRVFRVVDGEERTIYVNVSDIIKRGDRSKDISLKANDIVWVPESLF